MEDIDDFEPDSSGALDLKYQGLTKLDPRVLSYTSILFLDLSHNLLNTLPDEISLLQNLGELHCASNKLVAIPDSVGSIKSLRRIKANNNSLVSLPPTIGFLTNLESLILSDNILTSLPDEIGKLISLKSLHLQNNALCRLPLSLALLRENLIELDVASNDEQLQITLPRHIHQDANSILWILALQREKTHRIESLKSEVKLLQHQNNSSEEALAQAQQKMEQLEAKKRELEDEMESVRYYLTARHHCRELRRKALALYQSVRRAWARKYSEYQGQVTAQVSAV